MMQAVHLIQTMLALPREATLRVYVTVGTHSGYKGSECIP